MEKRVEWVDISKGIGIILVVYGHVILGVHDANIGFDGLNYGLQHSFIYTMHMPLFYFLSGIFAGKWVKRDMKTALTQKVRSLLIPYILWGFIQAGIMQLFSGSTNNGQGLANALELPIRPYAQFWFLYDLFWIFIIYYVLVNVLKITPKMILIISLVMLLISPTLKFWELQSIFYQFPFFITGTFVLGNKSKLDKINLPIALISYVVLNLLYYFSGASVLVGNAFSLVVAISGITLVIAITSRFNSRLLSYIGKSSIAIYVMHIIATAGTRIIMIKLGVDNVSIHIILGTLVGVIAPLMALEIFKKMKIDKYLF
ncbi:acyltransferase [Enterococcus faecium]|uniref:acyltransferase family protein n=1 Tax=Enterococcus faecium TaxID=1352 RepID=UPI001F06DE0F|nr:acyltransferase [Enterococcus faecium]MCH1661601.1 acyltransferase [Enterococcus faecium]WDW17283.1 acyltransferase [Enterococcus faecium]